MPTLAEGIISGSICDLFCRAFQHYFLLSPFRLPPSPFACLLHPLFQLLFSAELFEPVFHVFGQQAEPAAERAVSWDCSCRSRRAWRISAYQTSLSTARARRRRAARCRRWSLETTVSCRGADSFSMSSSIRQSASGYFEANWTASPRCSTVRGNPQGASRESKTTMVLAISLGSSDSARKFEQREPRPFQSARPDAPADDADHVQQIVAVDDEGHG